MRLVLPRERASQRAFTLIEVTLALGIVAFAVVSILGVIPVAVSSGRQSVDEGRASAVANTLFATFRSQPFQNVRYLDSQYDANGNPIVPGLNFSTIVSSAATTSANPVVVPLCAKFLDPVAGTDLSGDSFGDQRRLCFLDHSQAAIADYSVTLNFSWPEGVAAVPGQVLAVQIEMVVAPVGHPQNVYRFVSTIINRAN